MSKLYRLIGISILLSLSFSFNISASSSDNGKDDLWLTGPLITSSARVIPAGHVNIEPYLFSIVNTGAYNEDWGVTSTAKFFQLNPQVLVKAGVTENIDMTVIIQSYYNRTQDQQGSKFGDIPFTIGYQIYKGDSQTFIRTSLQLNLPTGKFDRLNPFKLGTDIGGAGSLLPTLSLGGSRVFYITGLQYCRPRVNISYTVGTPVHVKGTNVYRGDPTTRGKVFPGNNFSLAFGIEYTLSKSWALACDFTGEYTQKTRFKGWSITGCGRPSNAQYTLAPAIEYNWSESMGIIVGSWFSVAGRNIARFYSTAAAYNYYF